MTTKITSPIQGHTDRSTFGPVTLEFRDGVAETPEKLAPGLLAYLEGRGYKVEAETEVPEGAPAESWTVPRLTAWAKTHDVDLGGAKTKADIVAVVVPAKNPGPSDLFDPGQHSVDDVRAYLDGLDASDLEKRDAELQRVVEAEKAGKNRPTLLEGIEGTPAGGEAK
ncbi:hypothetical protein AB0O99_04020 [Cellulosimicrobium funkei]|uniref:hypothetical protein n=1 Tax=Cellulosimicrobium funkei TaxID=264251 RepID=UPI0034371F6B